LIVFGVGSKVTIRTAFWGGWWTGGGGDEWGG
jgi:hypothetical protein